MNTKLIIGIAILLFSSFTFAKREHLKCYLQLDDKSNIIERFVYQNQTKDEFVGSLVNSTVFMADGVSTKKIKKIYECVNTLQQFVNGKAVKLEKKTPF